MRELDFIRLLGRNRVLRRFGYENFDFVIKRKSFLPRLREKNFSVTIEDSIKKIVNPTWPTDEISYQETAIRVEEANTQLKNFILQVEYVRFPYTYKGFNLVYKIKPGSDNANAFLSNTRQQSSQVIHTALESLDGIFQITEATSREELISILTLINKNVYWCFVEIDDRDKDGISCEK